MIVATAMRTITSPHQNMTGSDGAGALVGAGVNTGAGVESGADTGGGSEGDGEGASGDASVDSGAMYFTRPMFCS